jgi:hypothetical protein
VENIYIHYKNASIFCKQLQTKTRVIISQLIGGCLSSKLQRKGLSEPDIILADLVSQGKIWN